MAWVMLLVFAISVMPKTYFHELLAGHKDGGCVHPPTKAPCAHQQAFNCHFDDLVVTAPFLKETPVITSFTKTETSLPDAHYPSWFAEGGIFHTTGRGPPVI